MSEEAHAGCWAPDGRQKEVGKEGFMSPRAHIVYTVIYKDSLGKSVETGLGVKKTMSCPVSQRGSVSQRTLTSCGYRTGKARKAK